MGSTHAFGGIAAPALRWRVRLMQPGIDQIDSGDAKFGLQVGNAPIQ